MNPTAHLPPPALRKKMRFNVAALKAAAHEAEQEPESRQHGDPSRL
jgi:hypothetical protein